MELSKIECRLEEMKAYENVIERVNEELNYELNVISGKYEWANENDIERAKVRCAALHDIIAILEREALK